MSQIEILTFLKNHKRKQYFAIEIAHLGKLQKENCLKCLKKLRAQKTIAFKLLKKGNRKGNRKFIYKFKK